MRILLLVLWALIPIGVLAYHLGPGQSNLRLDEASQLLSAADGFVADQQWAEAQTAYDKALSLLPDDKVDIKRRVELERCKVMMNNAGLSQANQILEGLVEQLSAEQSTDQGLLAEARTALANSQYYMTWLMRLEGQPRELWEKEITSAQQNYRLLAQQAEESGDTDLVLLRKEDLESSVRLARMELAELQGLPLPSQ